MTWRFTQAYLYTGREANLQLQSVVTAGLLAALFLITEPRAFNTMLDDRVSSQRL